MARDKAQEQIIIDTGILYAIADKRDAWHKASVSFITDFTGRLVLASTVVPEVCYLINKYLGQKAEVVLLNAIVNREFVVEHPDARDIQRCIEIIQTYSNVNLGYVDASIVAISERLGISNILTADRRHFSIIKPKTCSHFNLLP